MFSQPPWRLSLLVVASGLLAGCAFFSKPRVQQAQPVAATEPPAPEKPAEAAQPDGLAKVRERLQLEVTDVTGAPVENAYTAAQATAVGRIALTPAAEGYEAHVTFAEPVRRPFAGGALECTLEAAPAGVPVPKEPEAGTKVRVAATVKSCVVSEPRPEKFRVADHVLVAELDSFSPVGGAYLELKNLTGKPVKISSATVTYFDQVASRANLATEILPRGTKTVTVSAAFHKQLDWPAGGSTPPEYTFGVSITYVTSTGATETLAGTDHIRASR
jgi:hypothetical protein